MADTTTESLRTPYSALLAAPSPAKGIERAMKNFDQDYFWAPGEALPERLPNLGAALEGR